VPVDDIFRYAMYFENYGQQRNAMAQYAALTAARNASPLPRLPGAVRGRLPVRDPDPAEDAALHPLLSLT
jgi:hypothetical protein